MVATHGANFDVMYFSLEKYDDDTLPNELTINRFLETLANKIGANVMTLCEGPTVNNNINKIAVV